MTEPTAADDHEHAEDSFRRRMTAILAQHAEPAKPEDVRDFVEAYNRVRWKRVILLELLSRGRGGKDMHRWTITNRDLITAWDSMIPFEH